MKNVNSLVQAMQENAFSLGFTWNLHPATVTEAGQGLVNVNMDGDSANTTIQAVSLVGFLREDTRVMLLLTPPASIFVIGIISTDAPPPGSQIARIRQVNAQSIPDAGSGTFITWDTQDYDPFAMWSSGTDLRIPFDGWYLVATRGVFASNATSRRGAFCNKNNTTSGSDTICGSSLQAPATGTCQLGGSSTALLLTTDVIGTRLIQNSGAPLNTASTDGGSVLDLVWLGPSLA